MKLCHSGTAGSDSYCIVYSVVDCSTSSRNRVLLNQVILVKIEATINIMCSQLFTVPLEVVINSSM